MLTKMTKFSGNAMFRISVNFIVASSIYVAVSYSQNTNAQESFSALDYTNAGQLKIARSMSNIWLNVERVGDIGTAISLTESQKQQISEIRRQVGKRGMGVIVNEMYHVMMPFQFDEFKRISAKFTLDTENRRLDFPVGFVLAHPLLGDLLEFDEDQQRTIDRAIVKFCAETKAKRIAYVSNLKSEIETTRDDISDSLSEEQRALLSELKSEEFAFLSYPKEFDLPRIENSDLSHIYSSVRNRIESTLRSEKPNRRLFPIHNNRIGVAARRYNDWVFKQSIQDQLQLSKSQKSKIRNLQNKIETLVEKNQKLLPEIPRQFHDEVDMAAASAERGNYKRVQLSNRLQESRLRQKLATSAVKFLLPHQMERLSEIVSQWIIKSQHIVFEVQLKEIRDSLNLTDEQIALVTNCIKELESKLVSEALELREHERKSAIRQNRLLYEKLAEKRKKDYLEFFSDPVSKKSK